ncbi:PREDICTED: uncharacterized protein LOC104825566 [Tarenaya hassleriana]|uniref:uncharacterized protein LOC104825566 n=1 Tax=Tarenaya hassleriana TaxID=28532 RepID=UPI0008FD07BC|nr:PREDICTED: uncharacterized protein LOC104825566 [Tarenaya hassleriana]
MEGKKVDLEFRNCRCDEDETSSDGGHAQNDVPIHSQVMKIKREFEKIKHPQPETRKLIREITGHQRSRSPLGLGERPITVGN